MSQKIPPPEPVVYRAHWNAGSSRPKESDAYFNVEGTIPRWGVVRSMQITISRNAEPVQAQDIWMKDFGVKLYDGEIWLSMQFIDLYGKPTIDNDYHVVANINFLGQTIELNVDWPENKEEKR